MWPFHIHVREGRGNPDLGSPPPLEGKRKRGGPTWSRRRHVSPPPLQSPPPRIAAAAAFAAAAINDAAPPPSVTPPPSDLWATIARLSANATDLSRRRQLGFLPRAVAIESTALATRDHRHEDRWFAARLTAARRRRPWTPRQSPAYLPLRTACSPPPAWFSAQSRRLWVRHFGVLAIIATTPAGSRLPDDRPPVGAPGRPCSDRHCFL